jgi:hypothetical protein
MLAITGCGGDGNGDPDGSTDTTTEQPSSCRQDPDPLNPHYRMTMLDLTSPDRLNNPALEDGIVREALNQETFLWLIRFTGVDDGDTDTDGTMTFLTGAGEVEDVDHNGCYPLWNDTGYPNITGNLDISGNDFTWPSAEPTFNIDVPIFNWDYVTFLLELPLKDVRITDGTFSADRSMIGTYSAGEWSCGATITGMITVADAREVYIPDMDQYLCAVLSGAVGDPGTPDDDCEGDPTSWPSPPDTEYEGEPAYAMSGCFAAEQVIVVD